MQETNYGIEDGKEKVELHRITASDATPEQKADAYNKWAPTYDEHIPMDDNLLWGVVSNKMFSLIKSNYTSGDVPVIVDAGCGTGVPASLLRKLAEKESLPIRLIGYDLHEGMLEQARKKNVFDELHVGDFFGEVPVRNESADYVLCSAVFFEGHCGPEALITILSHLRQGGMGLFSVRIKSFEYRKEEYYKVIEQAGCVVCQSFVAQYWPETKGMYVVVKKQ
ncbi:Methyltransferase [Gracilaria domingensis]|nr:Methyltransferase [Gracilaria domingensis]